MATTALCFTERRDPASHEIEATHALAETLEGTEALLIAGRRFKVQSADWVHPERTYSAEADYVIIHPTKGVVVIELKSPRSRNFFTDVYYKTGRKRQLIETTRASEALHQVFRNTLTVMAELSPHIAALTPTLGRRFSVLRMTPGSWAGISNVVSSYVVIYPSLPAGVKSPVGPQGITCIGFDQLVDFLTAPDNLDVPYFHSVDLQALEVALDLKNTPPPAVLDELASLPDPRPRAPRAPRLVKAPTRPAGVTPQFGAAPVTSGQVSPKTIPSSPNEPVSVQLVVNDAMRATFLSLVEALAAQAAKTIAVPQNPAHYAPLTALAVEVAEAGLKLREVTEAKSAAATIGRKLADLKAASAGGR